MAEITPVYVSTKNAKKISGLSEKRLKALIEQGIIRDRMEGQWRYYNYEDLMAYLNADSPDADFRRVYDNVVSKEVGQPTATKPKLQRRSKEMSTWIQSYKDGIPEDGHFWMKFSDKLTVHERMGKRGLRYEVDFRNNGNRRLKTISKLVGQPINTREEALGALPLVQYKLHQQANEPLSANGDSIRFSDFLPIYLEEKKADRERSYRGLETSVKNILEPYFSTKLLKDIDLYVLKAYLNHRREQGVKDNSIWQNELSPLKEILKMAIERGYISLNPVDKSKLKLKIKNRERYMLSSEEKKIWPLLKKHHPLDDMADFILDNAMRPANECDLQWLWIYWDEGLAIVPAEYHKQKTIGEYSLSDNIILMLERRKIEAEKFDDDFPYVFWREENGQRFKITTRWLQDHWSQVMAEAGVEDLHFYDLKHTCLSRLAAMGYTEFQLQSISNHLSIVSLARYAKPKMMRHSGKSRNFLNKRNKVYGKAPLEQD